MKKIIIIDSFRVSKPEQEQRHSNIMANNSKWYLANVLEPGFGILGTTVMTSMVDLCLRPSSNIPYLVA